MKTTTASPLLSPVLQRERTGDHRAGQPAGGERFTIRPSRKNVPAFARALPSATERKFQLAENIHVKGANSVNGLLFIELERVIPEEKKPRRIEIN